MGVNNRQRRAARVKQRARQQHHRDHRRPSWADRSGRSDPGYSPSDVVRQMLHEAVVAPAEHDAAAFAAGLAELPVDLVDPIVEAQLLRLLDHVWRDGWQPAEIVRHVRRADGRAGRLVTLAVLADHVHRHPSTLHPAWRAQVGVLTPSDIEVRPTGWLGAFGDAELLHRAVLVAAAVSALRAVSTAGAVHRLIPPPGEGVGRAGPAGTTGVDESVLAKVRALLAQAESTTFDAEAEAFTAKAEELMARHSIDVAIVWSRTEQRDRPVQVRVPVDDPYADIKSLLLQHVAAHFRCRTVWDDYHGWSTLVGFASDAAGVELLFTSLLVQSSAALQAEGARTGPGSRARSRGFRTSFLAAYARRIDERLAAISRAAEAAADDGSSTLLPALVARQGAVDDDVAELFGTLRHSTVRRGHDAMGWARGQMAADQARLDGGELRSGPDLNG